MNKPEPGLKSDYIKKLKKIGKEKTIVVKDLDGYFEKLRNKQ